jgi:hypothetical protein
MTRQLFATSLVLAVFGMGGVGSALAEPPSSLDPATPRAKVTVNHQHRKTASCYVHQEKGKELCRAKREDANSGATLVFTPIPGGKARLTGKDPRTPITVSLKDEKGTQQEVVELPEGRWSVEWQGASKTERLHVAGSDALTLSLRTVTGECKKTDREACALDATKVDRKLTVPDRYKPKD